MRGRRHGGGSQTRQTQPAAGPGPSRAGEWKRKVEWVEVDALVGTCPA